MRLFLPGLVGAVASALASASATSVTTCLQIEHLPEGKSPKLPSQRKNVTTEGGQTMPLGLLNAYWASSKILANVMKIIAEEVLGYNTEIGTSLGSSTQGVYGLGNCIPYTADCLETEKARDPDGTILSQYHFSFEIWENYFRSVMDVWSSNYPEKAPEEIGTVGYVGEEGTFVNPISINAGRTEDKLLLDYYRGYDTSVFNATALSRHFTPLDQISSTLLLTCSELMAKLEAPVQNVLRAYHAQFPNDTSVSYNESADYFSWQCDYQDTWWLSPACRNEPMNCIPVVTYNFWGSQMMQQATYFDMPIAVANTRGDCGWNCEWKSIVSAHLVGTYWWFPDDMFVQSDMKAIAFPAYNKEQYEIQGLQASQWQAIPLRKLMARGFNNIAGDAALLARQLWVPESNMIAMFKRSVDGDAISDLACEWVRENHELWHSWLPGQLTCNPGQGLVNEAGEFLSPENLTAAADCGWCEPGTESVFAGDSNQRVCSTCPPGSFQKSPGQVACEMCSPGKFTVSRGNMACDDCEVGAYAAGDNNTACTSCLAHESTMIRAAGTSWDCVCDEGYFRTIGHSESLGVRADCKACPEGMDCQKGNDAPTVDAGFWASEQNGIDREYSVYRCRDGLECPGGEAGTCAVGRNPSEVGCASCMLDYHVASGGECTKCEGSAVLPLIIVIFLTIFGLSAMAVFARTDVTKIKMNTVSVAICMSQTIMIVQTLSLFFTIKIDWIDPVKSMFEVFSIATFNFSALNFSCGLADSDVVWNYALRLLSFPLGLSVLCMIFAILHFVLRTPITKDNIFNSIGVLTLVLFLMLNMTALTPFHCISSPNGTASLSSNPSVICYEGSEWPAMAAMGIIAMLVYGVGFFSVVLYVTISYPGLVISSDGSVVMSRYRFMFQRFTAKCFYFTPIYLLRTLFVALIPVIFADYGHRQMIFLVLTMVVFCGIHAKYQPWRGAIPNALDVWVMGCMVLLLTCSSLLLEIKKDEMRVDLEIFFTVIMVFVFGAIAISVGYLGYRRFVPKDRWAAFLCHISDNSTTARLLKMEMEKRIADKKGVFLAADNLDWTLEDMLDLARCQLDNLVVLLSGGTLFSPPCAGLITTAHTNGVQMVPVVLESFTELCDADLDEAAIAKRWSADAFRRCTAEGISLTMVKGAYAALRSASAISCRLVSNRLADSHGASLSALAEVSSACGAGKAADGPGEEPKEYDVGVVADCLDSEAIAAVEVLKNMIGAIKGWKVRGLLRDSEVSKAAAPSQLILVVLTRGCLGSETFMQAATAALQAWPKVPVLSAKTDDFSFPTEETMQKVLAPQVAKGAEIEEAEVSSSYATLLASPSVSFVTTARAPSLEKNVAFLVAVAAEVAGTERTQPDNANVARPDEEAKQPDNAEPPDGNEGDQVSV